MPTTLQDDDQESVIIPDKNGQNYLCYLPKVEKVKSGKPVNQLNVSSMIVETEKPVKLKTPDELLEVLKDRCFIRVSINNYLEHVFCLNIGLLCAKLPQIILISWLELLIILVLLQQEGWWSYEFCYQRKLRQVHLEDDKVTH